MDIEAFFHMGGYAFYVWTAYGLALAVLLANLAVALRRNQQTLAMIKHFATQQAKTR